MMLVMLSPMMIHEKQQQQNDSHDIHTNTSTTTSSNNNTHTPCNLIFVSSLQVTLAWSGPWKLLRLHRRQESADGDLAAVCV